MIFVYIPCKDKVEAKKIAKLLLAQQLIACANIHSADSLYHWKGKLAEEKEFVVLCKTMDKHYAAIEQAVKKEHSYECPCILKWDVSGNKEYEEWVKGEVKVYI